jgi:hypothetical protein
MINKVIEPNRLRWFCDEENNNAPVSILEHTYTDIMNADAIKLALYLTDPNKTIRRIAERRFTQWKQKPKVG